MLLPKKLTDQTKINLVHTSSPVEKGDLKVFFEATKKLKAFYPNTKVFDVERTALDPRYLSASISERMRKFRQAIKEVDWLAPIYGGTGCVDIVRYLDDEELNRIRKNRPIVNGFSDTTFLLNYLHIKLRLVTFHYSNACGLFSSNNYKLFLDILRGRVKEFSFLEKDYEWLTEPAPAAPIEGIAIGGNLESFRETLDILDIRPKSWQPYILFIEDIGVDSEDLHRIFTALDERNIFEHIRAIVVGRMDEKEFNSMFKKFNFIFGFKNGKTEHYLEYLLSEVIKDRIEDGDPLHILQVRNLGHGVTKNPMIVPIGAKTVIHPDRTIEFIGPFVDDGTALIADEKAAETAPAGLPAVKAPSSIISSDLRSKELEAAASSFATRKEKNKVNHSDGKNAV